MSSATRPAFQRARRPEHKELRAASILEAARKLALEKGVRTVTLTDIATEAGLNKSAVLRYFETREEIYLRLTAEGWEQWAAAVRERLGEAPDGTPEKVTDALIAPLTEQPLFCDLLAHAPLNLERHVSAEAALAFKLAALGAVTELAAAVARSLPVLGTSGGRELVSTVTFLAGSLWQISHPSQVLATLYVQEPRLAHAVVDFAPQLRKLTLAMARGLATRGTAAERDTEAGD